MELHVILFVVATFVVSWLFWSNPVRRDRWLYARSGWGVFWYSLGLIICVLLAMWNAA